MPDRQHDLLPTENAAALLKMHKTTLGRLIPRLHVLVLPNRRFRFPRNFLESFKEVIAGRSQTEALSDFADDFLHTETGRYAVADAEIGLALKLQEASTFIGPKRLGFYAVNKTNLNEVLNIGHATLGNWGDQGLVETFIIRETMFVTTEDVMPGLVHWQQPLALQATAIEAQPGHQ